MSGRSPAAMAGHQPKPLQRVLASSNLAQAGKARATAAVPGPELLPPAGAQSIGLPYRDRLEERFGRPLDGLRVYSGTAVAAALTNLHAVAATRGNDIYLASPLAPLMVVAHEVAHALQTELPAADAETLEPESSRAEREASRAAREAGHPAMLAAPVRLAEGLARSTLALLRMSPMTTPHRPVPTPPRMSMATNTDAPATAQLVGSSPTPTSVSRSTPTTGPPAARATAAAPVTGAAPGEAAADAFELPPQPELSVSADEVAARQVALADAAAALSSASSSTAVLAAYAAAPPTLKAQQAGALGASVGNVVAGEAQEWQADVPDLHASLGGAAAPSDAVPMLVPPAAAVEFGQGVAPAAPAPVFAAIVDPGAFEPREDVTRSFNQLVAPTPTVLAVQIDGSLDAVQTTDPAVPRSAGPAPAIPLGGETDPARINETEAAGREQGALARAGAAQGVVDGPGPERVRPVALDQAYAVGEVATPIVSLAPAVGGPDAYLALRLPAEVQASFDAQEHAAMEQNMGQAVGQAALATTERDTAKQAAVADAESGVATLNREADGTQTAAVVAARTDIQTARQGTLDAQRRELTKVETDAAIRRTADEASIGTRVAKDQKLIDGEYSVAEGNIATKVAEGERQAAAKKAKAARDAENDSWWDRAVSFVKDAFDAVISAIGAIFDAIRSAVNRILDAVKAAALALIDAVATFIKDAIAVFGELLKAAITGLIGRIFPELAAKLNSAIDSAVTAAQHAVDVVANGLKVGVSALVEGLRAGLNAAINAFQAGITLALSLAAAAITGDWGELARRVLEAVLRLVGVDPASFYAFVGRAQETFQIIIDNPLGFVGNLVKAVAGGFQRFADNIGTHLQAGIIGWLTGALGSAGIVLPTSFDLLGVLDLARQLLGLTWDYLKAKARKLIGEKNVERLQTVFGFIETLVVEGWGGLWAKIAAGVATIRDLVFSGLKSFLLERVVMAAITKLASLFNPVGAIVQLVLAAWNLYTFLRDRLSRIVEVVKSVTEAIGDIARGVLDGAMGRVEEVLGRLLPLAIDLLARLLGLGNIGAKVKEIIEQVRAHIDHAIDALLGRAVGLFKGGREPQAKGDDPKDQSAANLPLDFGSEHHTVNYEVHGKSVQITIASARRGELRTVLRAAIAEVDKRRHTIAEGKDFAELSAQLSGFEREISDEEIGRDWVARGKSGTFQGFVEVRLNEILGQLKVVFQKSNIRSLDAIFRPAFAGTRFLPPALRGSKWIRPYLYESLRTWKSFRDPIVAREKKKIAADVDAARRTLNLTIWNRLHSDHQLPSNATLTAFSERQVYETAFDLDHHIPVSKHWNSLGGMKESDSGRDSFYFDRSNLVVVTHEYNLAKGGEKFEPFVEGNFTAALAEGGAQGAKTIQWGGTEYRFLDAEGGQPIP